MDASRFDAWTRRRFGAVAAGAVATLCGLADRKAARARRKKRRKRKCEKLGTDCNPHNDRKLCCGELACGVVPALGGHHCCRQRYAECLADSECCIHFRCVGSATRFCDIPA